MHRLRCTDVRHDNAVESDASYNIQEKERNKEKEKERDFLFRLRPQYRTRRIHRGGESWAVCCCCWGLRTALHRFVRSLSQQLRLSPVQQLFMFVLVEEEEEEEFNKTHETWHSFAPFSHTRTLALALVPSRNEITREKRKEKLTRRSLMG